MAKRDFQVYTMESTCLARILFRLNRFVVNDAGNHWFARFRGGESSEEGNECVTTSRDSILREVLTLREVSPRRNLLSTFTEIGEESAPKKWERKRRRPGGSKWQVSRIIENLSRLLSRRVDSLR